MIKKLIPYLGKYRWAAILSPLSILIESLCNVYIPTLMGHILNQGVLENDFTIVIRTGLFMIGISLLSMLLGGIAVFFATHAGQGFGSNLRHALYTKIQTFSFSNLDQLETPSLITRLTNDVTRLAQITQMSLRMAVRAPFMIIFAFIFAYRINARLSLIFLVTMPLLLLLTFVSIRIAFPRFRAQQKQLDRLNTVTQENLNAIRVVKSFVREDREKEKFDRENRGIRTLAMRAIEIMNRMMPLAMLIMYGCTVAILWFGGKSVLIGDLLPGDLYSLTMYVMQIVMGLMMVSNLIIHYTMGKASMERVIEVLDTEPELVSPEHGQKDLSSAVIEFDRVSFHYPGNPHCVVKHCSFVIPQGQHAAITGPTGSGKSTLVSLIPRLYDTTEGTVRVGGVDVKDYDLTALRDHISVVLQKNQLFSGTVRSNLLMGDDEADDETMWQALEDAGAADFIRDLPNGLDSLVEQNGSNFSGGQKQRLCIARALLKNPAVLILDDATSAVDTETERAIVRSLEKRNADMTRISITHRIASIKHCNPILVMDDGRIAGIGTHDDLLASCRMYREMVDSQERELA